MVSVLRAVICVVVEAVESDFLDSLLSSATRGTVIAKAFIKDFDRGV